MEIPFDDIELVNDIGFDASAGVFLCRIRDFDGYYAVQFETASPENIVPQIVQPNVLYWSVGHQHPNIMTPLAFATKMIPRPNKEKKVCFATVTICGHMTLNDYIINDKNFGGKSKDDKILDVLLKCRALAGAIACLEENEVHLESVSSSCLCF